MPDNVPVDPCAVTALLCMMASLLFFGLAMLSTIENICIAWANAARSWGQSRTKDSSKKEADHE